MHKRSRTRFSTRSASPGAIALTVVLGLLATGCSNGTDHGVEVLTETSERNAETTSSVAEDVGSADDGEGMEFNANGLVPIPPGTATTKVFVPAFEYTVPLG